MSTSIDRSESDSGAKRFTLLGPDGIPYGSDVPGVLGGNRLGHIYGRLDCPSALRALRQGGYVEHRVFFADESTAIAAGFRPCGTCLREKYRVWKNQQQGPPA
ncbi:MAG TPA: Ada metal-binding domain-containing protein [Flexivirga sp.]|uniref:Ada metal-binding domain-containing protein n=1 Tax=Flexivirga sp. TaxID=1962927 RepID=UPI002BE2E5A8|nr:Ada metal-binding domain-containing protein [Flexivirga sp.]HWC23657.1 Ada metal-binding domain-containing protein [Flexivirga sp.]